MNYTTLFSPEANNDLTDILGWYTTQYSVDTKKRFIVEVSNTLKSLSKSPKAYSIRLKNARCAPMKKHPYNVYYWVDDSDKTVNIFAILHQKRNPEAWKERIN
jgi:plasmid stabilization system protein ParE